MLPLTASDLEALRAGDAVAVFVRRGTVTEGDEVEIGDLEAVVVAVDPTALVDDAAPGARHVLRPVPDGDLVILRVYAGERPILTDRDFGLRVRAIEGAMR